MASAQQHYPSCLTRVAGDEGPGIFSASIWVRPFAPEPFR
jgi:hypothetical protein